MAHRGVVNVHTAFVVSFASVLGGDTIAFFLGRKYGRRFLQWKPAQRFFSARKQLRVRAYFRKFGSKVIFIGRFLPGLRFSIFFSAGTLCVKPAVFLMFDTLAALLSVPFLVYLAWGFGDHIDTVISWARRSEYGILVLAVVAVAVIGFKIARGRKLRRAEQVERTVYGGGSVADAAPLAGSDAVEAPKDAAPPAPPAGVDQRP